MTDANTIATCAAIVELLACAMLSACSSRVPPQPVTPPAPSRTCYALLEDVQLSWKQIVVVDDCSKINAPCQCDNIGAVNDYESRHNAARGRLTTWAKPQ